MNTVKKIGLFVCLSAFIIGCYRDNEASLYPQSAMPGSTSCDTTKVSYATTIQPIFSQNCALAGCHASSSPTGGYILDNYSGIKSVVLSGRLIGAITHKAGYSPMPKDGGTLGACELGLISSWVNQGALNN